MPAHFPTLCGRVPCWILVTFAAYTVLLWHLPREPAAAILAPLVGTSSIPAATLLLLGALNAVGAVLLIALASRLPPVRPRLELAAFAIFPAIAVADFWATQHFNPSLSREADPTVRAMLASGVTPEQAVRMMGIAFPCYGLFHAASALFTLRVAHAIEWGQFPRAPTQAQRTVYWLVFFATAHAWAWSGRHFNATIDWIVTHTVSREHWAWALAELTRWLKGHAFAGLPSHRAMIITVLLGLLVFVALLRRPERTR